MAGLAALVKESSFRNGIAPRMITNKRWAPTYAVVLVHIGYPGMLDAGLDHPCDRCVDPTAEFTHGRPDVDVWRGHLADPGRDVVLHVGHSEVD